MTATPSHLVVIANRLPVVIERRDGAWRTRPASGGLVTALAPVLRKRGGIWVGWAGTLEEDELNPDALLKAESQRAGFELKGVVLSKAEHDSFYLGFSNEVIWPLFHSLDERCNFAPAYWDAYMQVNAGFAKAVEEAVPNDSFLWVHDYHFMPLGDQLRRRGIDQRIGFFLHIPFPPLEIFLKLPWRQEVLAAMLAYDIIGFQALRDRRNFVHAIRAMQPEVKVTGRGRYLTCVTPERNVRVGAFPISIDAADFARTAATPAVDSQVEQLTVELEGRKLLLGVDRLDYTKGIPMRLRAFRELLQRYPELRRTVRFFQLVVPSRETILSYRQLKAEIEELVGEINGEFTEHGWVPIHYAFRSLAREELLAYYRLADAAVVTPVNDGMNLVAKEYCVSNIEEHGVLILSEFAGAAAELKRSALLVNPYDIVGMADAMARALTMPEDERRSRMSHLRRRILRNDVHRWVQGFLDAAATVDEAPASSSSRRSDRANFTKSQSSGRVPQIRPVQRVQAPIFADQHPAE